MINQNHDSATIFIHFVQCHPFSPTITNIFTHFLFIYVIFFQLFSSMTTSIMIPISSFTITIIIIITRPKLAYGWQGLDWIVGPEYSFRVFYTWKMKNQPVTMKSHKNLPGTMKNHEKPRKPTWNHENPWKLTWNHEKLTWNHEKSWKPNWNHEKPNWNWIRLVEPH